MPFVKMAYVGSCKTAIDVLERLFNLQTGIFEKIDTMYFPNLIFP